MRTVRRLRLRFLLDLRSSPTVLSTLLLFALSKPFSSPPKYTSIHLGGDGEIRTRVQDLFLFASYSNNSQYIFILEVCQAIN